MHSCGQNRPLQNGMLTPIKPEKVAQPTKVDDVKYAARPRGEVLVRARRAKRPQYESGERLVDDRPHGSDVQLVMPVEAGDYSFENHGSSKASIALAALPYRNRPMEKLTTCV